MAIIMECPHPGCTKRLSSKYNLTRHIKVLHQGIRQYFCRFCFRAFASKQNQHSHEYIHRTPEVEPIPPEARPPLEPYETQGGVLSELVKTSRNPDLRPFAKIRRIYYWPKDACKEVLPKLHQPATDGDDPLPSLF